MTMMAGAPHCAAASASVGIAPQSSATSPASMMARAHCAAISGLNERGPARQIFAAWSSRAVLADHRAEGADIAVGRQADELGIEAEQARGSEFETRHRDHLSRVRIRIAVVADSVGETGFLI
ncbi:hypothetical protein [Bosea sp. (in: a-proteobacteria)]|uniref:hypothetical protein n=1 Tax=Bosea sp. (in: a-proteobacteria) TaxID=1871050 RepID=UPI003F6F4BD8